MLVVRVLSISRHYNTGLKRFQSTSFVNSSGDGGGISVFELDCARDATGNICEHIKKFYEKIAGNPIVFWIINFDEIRNIYPDTDIKLAQSTSNTGDLCHYNIIGLEDKQAKKYFAINREETGYYYCCPNDTIYLSNTEIENILNINC